MSVYMYKYIIKSYLINIAIGKNDTVDAHTHTCTYIHTHSDDYATLTVTVLIHNM